MKVLPGSSDVYCCGTETTAYLICNVPKIIKGFTYFKFIIFYFDYIQLWLWRINITSAASAFEIWIFSQHSQVCTTLMYPMLTVVAID